MRFKLILGLESVFTDSANKLATRISWAVVLVYEELEHTLRPERSSSKAGIQRHNNQRYPEGPPADLILARGRLGWVAEGLLVQP